MTFQEVIDYEQQFDICAYCTEAFIARDVTGLSSCNDWVELDSTLPGCCDNFVEFCCDTCKNDFKEVYIEGSGYEVIDESRS